MVSSTIELSRGAVRPAGVVAQEDHDLAQRLVVELAVRVAPPGPGCRARRAAPVPASSPISSSRRSRSVRPGPVPDVGEEVVGGVAEEVARRRRSCRSRRPPPSSPGRGAAASGRSSNLPSDQLLSRSPLPSRSERQRAPAVRRRPACRPARSRRPGPSPPARGRGRTRRTRSRPRPSGAVVSRCMIAPGPPVIASVCRTTSPSATRSSPAASASRCASVAAVNATKCIMLRASFDLRAGADRAGVHDHGAHPRRAPARPRRTPPRRRRP